MNEKIIRIVTIPEKKGIEIQCECGHRWIYTGKSERYCSCPKCRTTITIDRKNKNSSSHVDVEVGGSPQHTMKIENSLA
ncbi:MAG: hypothetical protein R3321_12830 [Nitrososphaeraceae archaeon]|nr:hypothetical protein [Nitrososphaeraceae archaeon]